MTPPTSVFDRSIQSSGTQLTNHSVSRYISRQKVPIFESTYRINIKFYCTSTCARTSATATENSKIVVPTDPDIDTVAAVTEYRNL